VPPVPYVPPVSSRLVDELTSQIGWRMSGHRARGAHGARVAPFILAAAGPRGR
jgi:hypothetical protein